MVTVNLMLFGPAADAVGASSAEYQLTPPATVATLRDLLFAKYPELLKMGASVRFAVNQEYADAGATLNHGDEVAVIPPVSGGSADRVELGTGPISAARLAERIAHPSCGAVVTFEGVVRAESREGTALAALEYSAYQDMAIGKMKQLCTQVLDRFAIHDVAVAHRLGTLSVGEASVAVAVSAAHRKDAFDACRWVIDTLKADVPIWKKEIWGEGRTTWAAGESANA